MRRVFKKIPSLKGILKSLSELGMKTEDRLYWKFGRRLPPNTVIFREGEDSKQMYVIQSGCVSLTRKIGDRDIEIAILGQGEFFGEMSLLTDTRRSTTAKTVGEVRLLEIDEATFQALLSSQEDVAMKMLKRFASRINEANQYAERLIFILWRERIILYLLLLDQMLRENEISLQQIVKGSGLKEGIVLDILRDLESSGYISKLGEVMYRLTDREGLKGLIGKEEEIIDKMT